VATYQHQLVLVSSVVESTRKKKIHKRQGWARVNEHASKNIGERMRLEGNKRKSRGAIEKKERERKRKRECACDCVRVH
jgi:hypothetical protein